MQIQADNKVRRSVRLEPAQWKELKKFIKRTGTLEQAAAEIGISINTLADVRDKGTCHSNTRDKIVLVIFPEVNQTV